MPNTEPKPRLRWRKTEKVQITMKPPPTSPRSAPVQSAPVNAKDEKRIAEIMQHFDFAKVQKVMALLDWKWFGVGVPSEAELRETALELMGHLVRDKSSFTESGGLAAQRRLGDEIELSFKVASWTAHER